MIKKNSKMNKDTKEASVNKVRAENSHKIHDH